MGRRSGHTLSREEAKSRLLAAAAQLGPRAWVAAHPYKALVLALTGGLLLGNPRVGLRLFRALGRLF